MNEHRINIATFKITSSFAAFLIAAIVFIIFGAGETFAVLAGGAYCLITIRMYEDVAGISIAHGNRSAASVVVFAILKVILVAALLWTLVESTLAPLLPWFITGALCYVPGSLIMVLLGGRVSDSPCG